MMQCRVYIKKTIKTNGYAVFGAVALALDGLRKRAILDIMYKTESR
jgi:hypothetical protein